MTRPAHAKLVAIAVSALAVSACHTDHSDDTAPPTSASAVANAPPRPSASSRPPPAPQLCRAISVAGAPKISFLPNHTTDMALPTTIVESGDIPEDAWLVLDAPGKLTAKHPRTTRESTFTGPGRVRPCVGHGEESWVERGQYLSEPAAGERPGAEQWVITPAGVIRFGGGRVELDVAAGTPTTGAKVEAKVSSGTAYAWTGDDAGPLKPPLPAPSASSAAGALVAGMNDGWIRLDGPRTVTLTVKKPGKPEDVAAAGVERCKLEAKSTKDLASAVASPDAALRRVAPQHVIARRVARAACAVAAVRVELLDPSPVRDGFAAALKEAESDWMMSRPRGPHGRFH